VRDLALTVCVRICMNFITHNIPLRSPIPAGAALFGLSWDAGLASRRRSYTPIIISVGNTDYSGMNACSCIAYLPELPLSKKIAATGEGKRARHELVQACAGAIIDVLESHAQNGFRSVLHTRYVFLLSRVLCKSVL